MENTDAHWRQWGRFDPYRAVIFEEKYKRASLIHSRDEFFATGRRHVQFLMERLRRLYPDLAFGTAVDFGCGVARLTVPLASHFRKVVGVDISEDMLRESRINCASFGVRNADFVQSDDLLSYVPSGVQFVHSFLVLQHIAVHRGLAIIGRLADRLAPAGVCALHVPIDRKLSLSGKLAYFGKHVVPGCRFLFNIVQRKPISEPLMQMTPYPIGAVLDVLQASGVEDIWLAPIIIEAQPGVIWFGRKKGPVRL
jgi:SAM-dependent methyltransferase